jgi:hypothetical protein
VLGIATDVTINHGDDVRPGEEDGVASSAQALWDDFGPKSGQAAQGQRS